jgi:hypothetical protein
MPRAIRESLERFFETDFAGGNAFVAAGQSFFGFQTAGYGAGALALDFVSQDLSTRLTTGKRGYFSVHHYGADLNQVMNRVMPAIFSESGRNMADVIIAAITERTEIWDKVLGVSLEQIDPWQDPATTLDVLTLKGGAMAESMLDQLGPERVGRLLGALRDRRRGEAFTREDMIEAGRAVNEDLASWLDVWIDRTDLPGFTLGPTELERLKDDAGGAPRYQLRVVLRNEEPTPGLLRLEYRTGEPEQWRNKPPETSDPIHVPGRAAVEVGLVLSEPPQRLLVAPYLSLNRRPFNVPLPEVDEERVVEHEPFSGVREASWEPAPPDVVVVDDLDPGFSVEEAGAMTFWPGLGHRISPATDVETDGGLPVAQLTEVQPSRWSRSLRADAWGTYRHTAAIVRKGQGKRLAIFTAELPEAGAFRLECHLPERFLRQAGSGGGQLGVWKLVLVSGTERQDVEFNAGGGEAGWNELGEFDLQGGTVRLELSDATDGRLVVADAIRFTPARAAGS